MGVGAERGASVGSTPARTVAICTADAQWIAATSWPPNAGFHATSRSPSRSSSTASPVRPAPSSAATRDATSRPHAVDPVRMAHGLVVPASRATSAATSSSMLSSLQVRDRVGTPRTESVERGLLDGDDEHVAAERGGRAEQLACVVGAVGFGDHDRERRAGAATARPGARRPRRPGARRNASRSCSSCTAVRAWSAIGASAARGGARVTAMSLTAPTEVGDAAWPHGPAPRSAAVSRRMRSAGTAARPAGSTLAGSIRRSAHERIAGSSTSASSQPSSCSQRADTRSVDDLARWRTPLRNGTSQSCASSGPTWPVSASTELRPTSTRSKGPPEWRATCASALASACAVARVSEPPNAGSVTSTPSMSTSCSSPHAIDSRSASSAAGGPSVMTVTCDPGRAAASSTAWLTARRQYGLSSSSMPSRLSRPSAPSSISSNFGICFTRTAMRISRPYLPTVVGVLSAGG